MSVYVIEETYELEEKVSFAVVAKALSGLAAIDLNSPEVQMLMSQEEPVVFMAVHSCGGREWTINEGRNPAFVEDECFSGGWWAFREKDVSFLRCISATSGSSLTAEKNLGLGWTLTLEVPLESYHKPYMGAYWKIFQEALRSH